MAPEPPSPERPLNGSCLCGAVRFEVRGPFLRAGHCHCSRCRKHSGGAVGTQGRVRREDFRLLTGAERLVVYRPATDAAVKVFCAVCGSSLFGGRWPEGPEVSIRLGALDGDPGIWPTRSRRWSRISWVAPTSRAARLRSGRPASRLPPKR